MIELTIVIHIVVVVVVVCFFFKFTNGLVTSITAHTTNFKKGQNINSDKDNYIFKILLKNLLPLVMNYYRQKANTDKSNLSEKRKNSLFLIRILCQYQWQLNESGQTTEKASIQ